MFFFFKKKTAYEMRISDWSSDVCSSDLLLAVIDAHRVDALGVARRKLLDSVRILLVVSKPIINVPQEPSDDHAGKRADGRAKANKPDDGLTHAADLLLKFLLDTLVLGFVLTAPLISIGRVVTPTLLLLGLELVKPRFEPHT